MAYRTGNIDPQLNLEEHAVIGTSEVGVKKVILIDEEGNQRGEGLSLPTYDYLSQTANADNDVFVYKTGGASGTTVATVTVTYTDETKATISTVVKT